MALVNTGSFPKGLVPGVKSWHGSIYYKDHALEYDKIFDRVMSNRQYEEYVGTIGYCLAPVKTEGGPVTYDASRQGWVTRLTNVRYALGFIVTYEEMKNNNWGPVSLQRARGNAKSMRQTKENIAGLTLTRAFNNTYAGPDGVALIDASHVRKSDASTFSNELDTAADLSELSAEQLVIQIMQAEDERGLNIQLKPIRLIVHPTDVFDACRILESTLQNDTANNALNALKKEGVFPGGYAVNRYFSYGSGAWFIKTDCPDGMIYQEREGMKFSEDNDFPTENAHFKATEWYSMGWADPFGLWGTAGAA